MMPADLITNDLMISYLMTHPWPHHQVWTAPPVFIDTAHTNKKRSESVENLFPMISQWTLHTYLIVLLVYFPINLKNYILDNSNPWYFTTLIYGWDIQSYLFKLYKLMNLEITMDLEKNDHMDRKMMQWRRCLTNTELTCVWTLTLHNGPSVPPSAIHKHRDKSKS